MKNFVMSTDNILLNRFLQDQEVILFSSDFFPADFCIVHGALRGSLVEHRR